MEENHTAAFESIANGDQHDAASTAENDYNNTHHTHANNDHSWLKVIAKRSMKKKESNVEVFNNQNKVVPSITSANENGVLRLRSDNVAPARSKLKSDNEDRDNSDDETAAQKALPLLVSHCPSETCIVGGYTIPKGSRIFINVWAIHRDLRFGKTRWSSIRIGSWTSNGTTVEKTSTNFHLGQAEEYVLGL
ncbi:hypothetical protein FF1_028125 [Malus domestica]